MPIRLVIADEQPVARAGIKVMLRDTDFSVVGEASTGQQAVDQVRKRRPDVLLMELRFTQGNGLKTLGQIKLDFPDLPVLIFTSIDSPAHAARSVALGAAGLLSKSASRADLVKALGRVAAGESIWTRSELSRVTGALAMPRPGPEIDEPLSGREIEIVRRIAAGWKNRQIAEELEISIETVKEHVQHIFKKLHMNTRTHVALWALRAGLV